MADRYSLVSTAGLTILVASIFDLLLNKEGNDLLMLLPFIVIGLILLIFGIVGSKKTLMVNEIYKPLRDCLIYNYQKELNEVKAKRRYIGEICLLELEIRLFTRGWHADGLLMPRDGKEFTKENKRLHNDLGKLSQLTIDHISGKSSIIEVNDFRFAVLEAVKYKIKHPVLNYRGAEYFLKK